MRFLYKLNEMDATITIINAMCRIKHIKDFSNSKEWDSVIKFLKKEWPLTQKSTEFKTLKEYIDFEILYVPRAKREWDLLSEQDQIFFWSAVDYIQKNI